MKLSKIFCLHYVVICIIALINDDASAQLSSEFWIKIWDDAPMGNTVTLYFGNHINATYGKDSLNPTIQEGGACTDPFSHLEAKWRDIPGRQPVMSTYCGFFPHDFRGVPENSLQKDTFKLAFTHLYYPSASATIRWPKTDYLEKRCDSMILLGKNIYINMFEVDSVFLPHYQDSATYFFKIYKYGCNIIDAVDPEYPQAPTDFALHQNYPNPFNPITKIEYALPTNAKVNLKIYDVLGREVKTLVDEIKDAGYKSIEWNSTNNGGNIVASGVYFYILEAISVTDPSKTFTQAKKIVLVR